MTEFLLPLVNLSYSMGFLSQTVTEHQFQRREVMQTVSSVKLLLYQDVSGKSVTRKCGKMCRTPGGGLVSDLFYI